MNLIKALILSFGISMITTRVDAQLVRFATVNEQGVIPVADEEILISPCAPVNPDCQEQLENFTNAVQSFNNTGVDSEQKLDNQIRQAFLKLPSTQSVQTNLSGELKIPCKTQNCLIYGSWLKGDKKLFWLDLYAANTNLDYVPSKAIQINASYNEIFVLYEESKKVRSRMKTGVSYQDIPDTISPFINALDNVKNSDIDDKFGSFIFDLEKVRSMISVLQTTWRAYIDSTRYEGRYVGYSHNISCKNAKKIVSTWNSVVNFEDITLKTRRGLLGCSISLDKFGPKKNRTTFHSYMFRRTLLELDQAISSYENTGSNIDISESSQ